MDGAGIVPPEQMTVCGNKRSGVSRASARLHPLLPGGLRAAQAQTPGAAPGPSARSPTPHPREFRASSKSLACGSLSRTCCCERATRLSPGPGPCTSQGTRRAGGEHTHTHPQHAQCPNSHSTCGTARAPRARTPAHGAGWSRRCRPSPRGTVPLSRPAQRSVDRGWAFPPGWELLSADRTCLHALINPRTRAGLGAGGSGSLRSRRPALAAATDVQEVGTLSPPALQDCPQATSPLSACAGVCLRGPQSPQLFL